MHHPAGQERESLWSSDQGTWKEGCATAKGCAHQGSGLQKIGSIGFELLLKEHALGLTERRAAWAVKWARETASAAVVHVRAFEEALGRIVFATSALELLHPFLSPLYAFATSGPRDSVRSVPGYVSFFLRFIAKSVEQGRNSQCAATVVQEERARRVDAQASDERTGVGGWLPTEGPDGRPDPSRSQWFSEKTVRRTFRGCLKGRAKRRGS